MTKYWPGMDANEKAKLTLLSVPLHKFLSAAATGQNVATVQPWFPSAGAVTVRGDSTYLMEGYLAITSGATSRTVALSFTGTATVSSISYTAMGQSVAANTTGATIASAWVNQASATVILPASTATAMFIRIRGLLRITADLGGTIIPNFTFSADPTGTISVQPGTKFVLHRLGDLSNSTYGTWA